MTTFDGVVRLTRIGTSYLVFTLVIGFAALNTGNTALYIALTFMLGCLLLSGIASKGGLKHLEVAIDVVEQPWVGRVGEAALTIRNSSKIWNVRDVVVTGAELAKPVVIPIVLRNSEVRASVPLLFQKRGRAALTRLDFYTRYPFGFFLKKRRIRIDGEVVVFPRLLGEDARREHFRSVEGEMTTANRPGQGTEVHSFRDYVRGDSLRHVAWKKSASLGRWIMKQTEADAARVVNVVVDPYQPPGVTEDELELMISEAATFLFHAMRRGLDVIFSLPRVTLRAKEGESGTEMFRALAFVEASHEPAALAIDRDAVVFSIRRAREPQTA